MKKIGDITNTADKNGEFTDGNVAAGTPPTQLMGAWFNSVQREILNVLAKAGIPQSAAKEDQLAEAITKIVAGAGYLPTGYSYSKIESDGKYQPKGNYAPAGDYATNTALNNGLDRKFDKTEVVETTGSSTTKVMSQNGVTKALRSSELIQSANQIIRDTKSDASDFNNAKANAAFFGYATALNNAAITGVGIDIAQIDNGYHLQLISAFQRSEIAFRTKNGDTKTWNDWCKFFHTGNVKVDRNGNLKTSDTSNALSDCCVGIPLPWPQSTAPTGYLICNGQTFNKTTYPLLALAYPSGVLPDLRGEFIRGLDTGRNVDSGRAALSAQSDAIRNIKGALNLGLLDKLQAEGAFKKTAYTEGSGGGSSGYVKNSAVFDASLVVPTANENRPRNIAFLYIVRAA